MAASYRASRARACVRANLGDPHQREDRLRALVEARRVLRPGRVVLAAGISRFASTIDRLAKEALADPRFETMVEATCATAVT
jgi:hypothetical protein